MTRTHFVVAVLVLAAALGASLLLYPRLPEAVPIHWNLHGQVDGYASRREGAFFLPGLMAVLLLLFRLLPWLSPRQFEVDSFRSTFSFLVILCLGFLGYVHALLLWAAATGSLDISRAILGGTFLFFALLGNVFGKVRRNFWIGVRTPWTLANERVWIDTHRFSVRWFVAVGIAGLLMMVAGLPIIASLVLLIASAPVPIVYSLALYKRLERRGEI